MLALAWLISIFFGGLGLFSISILMVIKKIPFAFEDIDIDQNLKIGIAFSGIACLIISFIVFMLFCG